MKKTLLYFLTIILTTTMFGQKLNSKILQKGLWETNKYYQAEKYIYEQDTIRLTHVLSFAPCALSAYPRFKFHDKNQYDLLYDTALNDTMSTAIGKGKWEFNNKGKQLSLHYYNAKFGSNIDNIDTYRYNKTYLYTVIKSSDSLIILVRPKL